jgi:hypothetical protein
MLAGAVRFGLLFAGPWSDLNRALTPDSSRYVVLAENLRNYGVFGKPEEDGLMHQAIVRLREGNGTLPPCDSHGLRPESFRTPAYPLYLAAILTVFGDLRAALVGQCLMGSLAAVLVVGMARKLGISPRWSIGAGLVWALHPGLVTFDNLLLTESLFNALVVAALWLAVRAEKMRWVALVGLLLAVAGLTRPLGLLYLPAAAAAFWPVSRSRVTALCCLTVTALVPTLFWCARNQAVGEGFRITAVGDLNFLFYSAAYTISEERGEDWLASWPKRIDENEAALRDRLSPGEDVAQAARRLAFEKMRKRPGLTAKVHAKSQLKLMVDHSFQEMAGLLGLLYSPSGLFSRFVLREKNDAAPVEMGKLIVPLVWVGTNAVLALFAFLGLASLLVRRQWRLVIICGVTIALFMAATGCVGLERFRLPLLLPLLLSAASFLGLRRLPQPEAMNNVQTAAVMAAVVQTF